MDRCEKHKEYRGIKAPDYECETCLSIFASVGGQRPQRIIQRKATVRHKDKSKYNRKKENDYEF